MEPIRLVCGKCGEPFTLNDAPRSGRCPYCGAEFLLVRDGTGARTMWLGTPAALGVRVEDAVKIEGVMG